MAPEQRDRIFAVRMSDAELQMLSELADQSGLRPSDIVRQLVRREYTEKIGAPPKSPKPKPRKGKG